MIRRITAYDVRGGEAVLLDFVSRFSARGVLLDEDGRAALLHLPELGVYKLPGGGIEAGESGEDAFLREIREETGFAAEVVGELGVIEEHKAGTHFMQLSYCYIARTVGDGAAPALTADELALGMRASWLPLSEALEAMNRPLPESLDDSDRFMVLRDRTILEEARRLLAGPKGVRRRAGPNKEGDS